MYGTTLRLPGAFFNPAPDPAHVDVTDYVQTLKTTMRRLRAVPPHQCTNRSVHLPPDLANSTHVFIRHGTIRKPLQPPYDGPYRVISHTSKYYSVDVNGKQEVVSVDCLKPAYLELSFSGSDPDDQPQSNTQPVSSSPAMPHSVT